MQFDLVGICQEQYSAVRTEVYWYFIWTAIVEYICLTISIYLILPSCKNIIIRDVCRSKAEWCRAMHFNNESPFLSYSWPCEGFQVGPTFFGSWHRPKILSVRGRKPNYGSLHIWVHELAEKGTSMKKFVFSTMERTIHGKRCHMSMREARALVQKCPNPWSRLPYAPAGHLIIF